MSDQRLAADQIRNMHKFEAAAAAAASNNSALTNKRADLFLRSESPRVQQILLHQKLREDLEKNSAGRVRYLDSELHSRNLQNNSSIERSPNSVGASEIQIATLNIGLSNNKQSTPSSAKHITSSTGSGSGNKPRSLFDLNNELIAESATPTSREQGSDRINRNCQVCLIKEVRQDLMNINKIVQQRNEQITKLKAKCLRSYFERQIN